MPQGTTLESLFAISSDGRRVAYAAGRSAADSTLFVRELGSFEALAIEDARGAAPGLRDGQLGGRDIGALSLDDGSATRSLEPGEPFFFRLKSRSTPRHVEM